MLALGSVQVVKRKSIVIIKDALVKGLFSDEIEVQGEDGLWVSALDLNAAKATDAKVKIYGAWQIALHNNLIKTSGWYLLLVDKDNGFSAEFQRDGDKLRAVSMCDYTDGKFVNSHVIGDSVIKIDLNVEKLKFPKTNIVHAEQYYKVINKREKLKRKFQVLYLGFITCAFLVLFTLSKQDHDINQKNILDIENQIQVIQSERRLLSDTKINKLPSNTAILNQMLNVLYIDNSARTKNVQYFESGIDMLVTGELGGENRMIISGLSFVRYPTGEFKVKLKND